MNYLVGGDDDSMRDFFHTGPRWAQGTIAGLFFGLSMGLLTKLTIPTSWTQGAICAVTTGPAFGIAIAWMGSRQANSLRQVAGDLPSHKYAAAVRASNSGPMPDDPDVRRVALALARRRLPSLPKLRNLSIALVTLMLAALVLNVLDSPDWRIALYLLAIPLFAVNITAPTRLRRRIEQLEQGNPTPPPTPAADPGAP